MQGVLRRNFALFAKSENPAATNLSQRAKISSRRSRPAGGARTRARHPTRRARRQPPSSAAPSRPSSQTSPSASRRACSRSRSPSRERRFACSTLPCGEGTRPRTCSHTAGRRPRAASCGERGLTRAERRNGPESPTYRRRCRAAPNPTLCSKARLTAGFRRRTRRATRAAEHSRARAGRRAEHAGCVRIASSRHSRRGGAEADGARLG